MISELTSYHNNNIYAYHYMFIYNYVYKNQMTFRFSYFFFRVFFLKYGIVHPVFSPGVLKL